MNKILKKLFLISNHLFFGKKKDLVKQQIKIWSLTKIQNLLIKVNKLELLIKKKS